jgi:hypothetical protein
MFVGCHRISENQRPVQSVFITTKVVSSNPADGEVFAIHHYMIKFVSDLPQVGGFLWVLWFPPPIKLTENFYVCMHYAYRPV